MQDACDESINGDVLLIQDLQFYEDIYFDRDNFYTTIKGGCNQHFEPIVDVYSIIKPSLPIDRGSVEVENLTIATRGYVIRSLMMITQYRWGPYE